MSAADLPLSIAQVAVEHGDDAHFLERFGHTCEAYDKAHQVLDLAKEHPEWIRDELTRARVVLLRDAMRCRVHIADIFLAIIFEVPEIAERIV